MTEFIPIIIIGCGVAIAVIAGPFCAIRDFKINESKEEKCIF
jgi:hypothetical protein